MRTHPSQTSFAAGQLGRRLHDRVDLEVYDTGLASCINYIPTPHGPLFKRNGTEFVEPTKDQTKLARLIPFKFSVSQSIMMEFGHQYIRFFHDGSLILDTEDDPYEVATPYLEADISKLNWAQSADVVYLVHPKYKPRKLSRLANNNWTLQEVTFIDAPTDWTTNNWPSCVAFFEQRLFYASTPTKPQTIWASRTAMFDTFTLKDTAGEVLDDMGFEYTMSVDDVNGILWMRALDAIAIGTASAEYRLSSSSLSEALTPTNVRVTQQTNYGSAQIRPVQVGAIVLFIPRNRDRMRSFEYSFVENKYSAIDLTVYCDDILEDLVNTIDLQVAPDTFIWCLDDVGNVKCLTYEKQQKVIAWSQHTFNGYVESLAVMPGLLGDEIWMIVRRTINGQTKRHIEAIRKPPKQQFDVEESFFVDCGITYRGAPATEIPVAHLEGQTVNVLVDGWVHPPCVVTDGVIQLQAAGSIVHAGLPYSAEAVTLNIQVRDQPSLGAVKRITNAIVSVLASLGLKYNKSTEPLFEVDAGPTETMDAAAALRTEYIKIEPAGDSDENWALRIVHDYPLPSCIRSLTYTTDPKKI